MFKTLFPKSPVTDINKYINKKVALHACNNSSIPQLDACKVVIDYNNTELPCNFFVVSTNGPALLGMLDCD